MKKMWNNKMKNVMTAWLLVVSMVVPMLVTGMTAEAEDTSLKDYDAMTMEQILKSDESLTWVFAGDSITHNGSWSQGMNSYSEWFEQYLYDINRDDDSVVLTAWGGADIYDFQYEKDTPSGNGAKANAGMGLENMITKYNPDVVFIKLGMNDRGKSTEEFTKYYNMMLEGIYAEGKKNNKIPKVVILTPTPLSGENLYDDSVYPEPSASIQDNTLRHRNALAKIAEKEGLLFCDLRTAFLQEQLRLGEDYRRTFFSDPSDGGIHPNAAGQYLIFKTLSKTLGIYDEENELYQIEYADANSAALYVDDTSSVTYTNNYGVPKYTQETSANDNVELLASVDLNDTNGTFVGGDSYADATRIDLTDSSLVDDALTLAEAQSLENEFSVVFRAKLDVPHNTNQAVLFLSSTGDANWNNALVLGVPGKSNQFYYNVRSNGNAQVSSGGGISAPGENITIDGNWHTFAIVQTASNLLYYIDGNLAYTLNPRVNSGYNIGDIFANATTVTAHIGSYSKTSGPTYNLKGNMDYYQLYKGALTAEQVADLVDIKEMDSTMATVSGATALSSVDFTSTTGDLVYNTSDIYDSTVDLTIEAAGVDTLTVEELKTVGKEYSVVFRAKLNSAKENQPIIYLSTKAGRAFGSSGHNLLMLGVPGSSNLYYAFRENGTARGTLNTSTTNYGELKADINDGEWHTVAMVQSETGMTAYVDGEAYSVKVGEDTEIVLEKSISELFANISDEQLDAAVGRYDTTANTWKTQGKFDYWQFYGKALSEAEVDSLLVTNDEGMNATMPMLETTTSETVTGVNRTVTWKDTVGETYVWAVAGAEQMSGYEGPVVNRSLFRLLDNVMRGGGSEVGSMRDVRLINLAKPGNTVAEMLEDYDLTIGEHDHNVLLVLPEVSQVYADGYTHSETLVEDYATVLKSLIAKEDGKVILWTPLASNDEVVNGYIDDYANVVRKIAAEDGSVLFFDANKFMNDSMNQNKVLARNWFEEDMYISPLCAVDVATSFYQTMNLSSTGIGELTGHNLRLTSDIRKFKGEYVRDYIESAEEVEGTKVTIDVSAIKAVYPSANIWFSALPKVGTGNFNENIVDINDVTVDGSKYTFEAPYTDPVIAVYASVGSYIYRFKDVEVDVTTSNTIGNTAPNPTGAFLDELEVVGAPALTFNANVTSYNVTLYQYQRFVQINAEAQEGLTIHVNGKEVESGENSHLIEVDAKATVTVKVSGTVNGKAASKTYTLNLVRPEYPDIIVTEVMQDGYGNDDQAGGDNYELIEIYNASGKDLNLKDYSIGYKKDYRYTGVAASGDAINYYFTGNNQAFQSTSGSPQTYTGINKITKYSSYWSNNTVTEPDVIEFPADSTMVIWVKFAASGAENKNVYSENLTYNTLIQSLKENKDTYTLSVNGEAVVPALEQLVVAEIPKGAEVSGVDSSNQPAASVSKNFYMDNHGAENDGSAVRSWLFILGANATQSTVGAITEEGNNIISATKFGRLNPTNKLSSVFYYDVDRGMSVVKDEAYYDASTVDEGHTSEQQGYSNLTSFGAIEYWQKPYNYSDKTAPKVTNNTSSQVAEGSNASINLQMSDETDLRYVELYIMKEGEVEWTKVAKDYVIESCVASKGSAKNVTGTKAYLYDLGKATGTTQYYAVISDGINMTKIGSIDNPLEINATSKATKVEVGAKITVQVGGKNVEIIVGDVNGDKKVNVTDYVLVKAHLLKKRVLTSSNLTASDVNGDGRTNITDFVLIKRYLIK